MSIPVKIYEGDDFSKNVTLYDKPGVLYPLTSGWKVTVAFIDRLGRIIITEKDSPEVDGDWGNSIISAKFTNAEMADIPEDIIFLETRVTQGGQITDFQETFRSQPIKVFRRGITTLP